MNWLKSLISGAGNGLLEGVGGIIGKFKMDPAEKAQVEVALKQLVANHERELELTLRAEIEGKTRVMVAELQSDDKFTKRTRPVLVRSGIALAFLQALLPFVAQFSGQAIEPIVVPVAFWVAWGGATSVYSYSRSRYDKQGIQVNALGVPVAKQPTILG